MEHNNIFDINGDSFNEFTATKGKLVFVDFWAPWCMPCRALAPVLGRLAGEYPDNLIVGKLNIDENRAIAIEHGVSSIPNVHVFKDGEIVEVLIGVRPYEAYKTVIGNHI